MEMFHVATDVRKAAFVAFMSAGSDSFFRIKETHSSWPCRKSKESKSEVITALRNRFLLRQMAMCTKLDVAL